MQLIPAHKVYVEPFAGSAAVFFEKEPTETYGKLRGKSFNPNAEGVEARTIDRIDTFGQRLKNATIRHGHYADLVKEFDGKDTFFFLDPPYPGHNVEVGEDAFDEVEAAVELGSDAADLDHPRALVKALAVEADEPQILVLARELDRIDGASDERAAALARELLPISDRLAPALEAVPAAAAALREATPVLGELAKAQWSRAFINDLPDDAFLYIEPGGEKDEGGKTVPRSNRHFPFRDRKGDVDIPHLRNAIARIPQSNAPGLDADAKQKL